MWPRDVNDVTHRKRGLRFEKSLLVEIETWARPDEFVRYELRACWVGGRWKRRHRKIVPLSSLCRKTFKLKGNKSFVPELRSRKCFCIFGISMFRNNYEHSMNISHIHVWLCYKYSWDTVQNLPGLFEHSRFSKIRHWNALVLGAWCIQSWCFYMVSFGGVGWRVVDIVSGY